MADVGNEQEGADLSKPRVTGYRKEEPGYPDARRWAMMAGMLGLAAGMGFSCSPVKGKEKALVASSANSVISGYHDYIYTIKKGDTLKSVAGDFYETVDPKDCTKIVTANPKLKKYAFDAPLPMGKKIIIPSVGRISFGS